MVALPIFEIRRHSHDGLPVYDLDGGMSAEYAVQKALASLAGGVAHTWRVQAPGMGPNPVTGSPDFLAASVRRTVAYYDGLLGPDAPVDTVVIGTGVSSASYVCHALGAPFLPVHFLLSTGSITGTRAVLDQAGQAGLPAYATLGYDESMPGLAVAWIKLLALPAAYRDFLVRHRVRHVVLLGTTGVCGQFARRPLAMRTGTWPAIGPGDVLVTWPDCGSQLDDTWLRRTVGDLAEHPLEEPARAIADWESGLGDEQLRGLLRDLPTEPHLLRGSDYLAMYDVATFAHTALLACNGIAVTGIAANPYLVTHPVPETRAGQVPFVYWQLADPAGIVARLRRTVGAALGGTPEALHALPLFLNTTRNVGGAEHAESFAGALRVDGFTDVRMADTTVDEVYGEATGAPCRRAAEYLRGAATPVELARWNSGLCRLDLAGLGAALASVPGVRFAAVTSPDDPTGSFSLPSTTEVPPKPEGLA